MQEADCITAARSFDSAQGIKPLEALIEQRLSGSQVQFYSELPDGFKLPSSAVPGMKLAFAFRTYPAEDFILVYQTDTDSMPPVVTGIYRTLRSGALKEGSTVFTAGMLEKYGKPTYSTKKLNVWLDEPDDPMIRRFFKFDGQACVPPESWENAAVFPQKYLSNNCGTLLMGDFNRAVLLDTGYIRRAVDARSATSKGAVSNKVEAPKVRF